MENNALEIKCYECNKIYPLSRREESGKGSKFVIGKTKLSLNEMIILSTMHYVNMQNYCQKNYTMHDIHNQLIINNQVHVRREKNTAWDFKQVGLCVTAMVGCKALKMIVQPDSHVINSETLEFDSNKAYYAIDNDGYYALNHEAKLPERKLIDVEKQICQHVSIFTKEIKE